MIKNTIKSKESGGRQDPRQILLPTGVSRFSPLACSAGLRLLEEYEAERAAKLQALREAVAVGLASGPDIPADEVFDRLEAKYLAMAEATERT